MKNSKSSIIIKTIISIFLFIFVCFLSLFIYAKIQLSPVSKDLDSKSVRFEIPYGASVYSISDNLKELNLIRNKKIFYYAVRFPFLANILTGSNFTENIHLKSGIYYIKPSMNFEELINHLSSGQQEYIKVSIPEGSTISKIAKLLEENNICNKSDFLNVCHDTSLLDEYKIQTNSLEGYLFPDTYFLSTGMNAETVARIMLDNFISKISSIEGISSKSLEELNDMIILASIVEKEYRLKEEAPLIASVFTNRLRRNIGLYSCATIVYIITEIEGKPHPERILIEDTKIDNPYNTYKWAGLPPGPISNPGLVALKAAANPPKTSYYFFQIVDPIQGRHIFTTTFDEHVSSHNLYINK